MTSRAGEIAAGTGSVLWWRDGTQACALTGIEIPFLPEPSESDRADLERALFQQAMAYMARAMHGLGEEGGIHRSFELRLTSTGETGEVLNIFVLILSTLEVAGSLEEENQISHLAADSSKAARILVSLAPQRLACHVIRWSAAEVVSNAVRWDPVEYSTPLGRSGLLWQLRSRSGLRKHDLLSWAPELDHLEIEERLARTRSGPKERQRARALVVPALLPSARGDMLGVASVLSQAAGRMIWRVQVSPTGLTREEFRALTELERDVLTLQEAGSPHTALLARTRAAALGTLSGAGFFRFRAEVLGEDAGSVRAVAAAWRMEFDRGERSAGYEAPSVLPVSSIESGLDRVGPDRSAVLGCESTHLGLEFGHGRPAMSEYRRQCDARLWRVADLISLEEVASLWRLPLVKPGGQAGLRSRPNNPFEQLPLCSDERCGVNGFLRVGRIRSRGRDLETSFVLPGTADVDSPSVLDRVIVVAGSPGSGKTNFAVNLLGQMWCAGTPFLVIDPTRGQEFRSLAPGRLIVFTVGEQVSPFRFNPFAVPRKVSVQTHIARVMACFRCAFHMWDPLPSIFEEAIRLAYARRLGIADPEGWNASSVIGEDMAGKMPGLRDVALAMGTGAPDERDSVLARMRDIWSAGGAATENQATIIASTSLRLASLLRNYGHIIGGKSSGEAVVDVELLLEHPVILEFGAIGNGQALSLLASFLLVGLIGAVETREGSESYHMLVLEEAHRLLSASFSAQVGTDVANPAVQGAEDLNAMLAEVRKYRQGVMILDQRPGALVGGVLDNAYVVAMHRLNERRGFDHLADMLNLTADQRRFARVGLEPGEAVMFDHLLGSPVLVRPPDLRIGRHRRSSEEECKGWRDRAAGLCRSEGVSLAPDEARRAEEALRACELDEVCREILAAIRSDVRSGQAPNAISLRRICAYMLGLVGEFPEDVVRGVALLLRDEGDR